MCEGALHKHMAHTWSTVPPLEVLMRQALAFIKDKCSLFTMCFWVGGSVGVSGLWVVVSGVLVLVVVVVSVFLVWGW